MRIQDIHSAQTELRGASAVDHQMPVGETEQTFKRQLSSEAEEVYRQQITELVNKINAQGKSISQRADVVGIQRYRALVQELMHNVVSNGYAFNKQGSLDYRGRQRIFTTIEKVNDKLDELMSEFLNGQSDQIRVMGKIDEIRGLLVDMVL